MPKIIDHVQYRADLLGHCFEVFACRGYGATTMRQLAIGAGVSTGTLYHYFDSKEALFEQMVAFRIEQGLREIGETVDLTDSIAVKVEQVFREIGRLQNELFQELILYVDYYQHQKRNEIENRDILSNIFKTFQPEIQTALGIHNPHAAQLLFSVVDGLLIAEIYGCQVNWEAQGKMMGSLMAQYAKEER